MENSLQPTYSQTGTSTVQRVHDARWPIAKVYLINAVFGTVIALVIWIALPKDENPGFVSNWVHAQSIGTIICSLILFTNCCIHRFKGLPDKLLLFTLPVIIIAGFYSGSGLASLILQLPKESTHSYDDNHLLIVSMAITVVVTIAITWFFTAQNTIAELRIKSAEESERAAQAHLSMLLAQIEPHMLFNTLANLRALISVDPQRAQEMLDLLIDFLRTTLQHSRTATVTLESEFQMLENYLSLMSIRLGDRLNYSITLPPGLKYCSIPSLILQPIVENAIKHGIEPSIEGGRILIRADADENGLTLWVEDTGIGMAYSNPIVSSSETGNDTDAATSGFGMSNVRARCTALSGGEFEVVSPLAQGEQGTRVRLQLPLSYEIASS